MRAALFSPMDDHAPLRQSEREKGAHGVQRNQVVGDTAKNNEQYGGQNGQNHNPVSENKTPAPIAEGVGQIVVGGDGFAEARKIREGGIRGKGKYEKNGGDRQVVKDASAKDRGDEHRQQALVAGLSRVGGRDAIDFHEIGNSRQQNRQEKNDDRQGALRVFHSRLAKRFDAIADRL